MACPVFSLRTRDSIGVGEFLDIERLVDICSLAGGGLYLGFLQGRTFFDARRVSDIVPW